MLQLINLPENAPPFLPTKPTHLLFIWKISLPIFCVENFLAQIFLCKLFLAFIHLYKHVFMCVWMVVSHMTHVYCSWHFHNLTLTFPKKRKKQKKRKYLEQHLTCSSFESWLVSKLVFHFPFLLFRGSLFSPAFPQLFLYSSRDILRLFSRDFFEMRETAQARLLSFLLAFNLMFLFSFGHFC